MEERCVASRLSVKKVSEAGELTLWGCIHGTFAVLCVFMLWRPGSLWRHVESTAPNLELARRVWLLRQLRIAHAQCTVTYCTAW